MSLYESGRSNGKISLRDLCDRNFSPVITGEVDIHALIDAIIRGGWPGNQDIPLSNAALLPTEYISGTIEDEVHRIDGVQRDKRKVRLLLRSLARNESTTVTNRTLKNDIKKIDDEDIDKDTVATYLDIF